MNKSYKTHIDIGSETITMGAAGALKGFSTNIFDLINLAEGVEDAENGEKVLVKSFRIILRMQSESNFGFCPVVVQTAGTWTDTVDLTDDGLEDFLINSVNDEFGLQKLRQFQMSKRVPSLDSSSASGLEHMVQSTYQMPPNVLQIINKGVNTERLQELYFGILGKAMSNSQVIYVYKSLEIEFIILQKNLVLR